MLDQLQLFFKLGFNHVLDINGYDHVLFLVVLTIPFLFKDYKKVIQLVTVFTIGHTLALVLSTYKIVRIDSSLVEFLIPVTIAITALYTIIFASRTTQNRVVELIIALFFGLIHGLGFSSYFKMMIGKSDEKLLPLLEFAFGLEVAQILIVLVVLLFSTIVRDFFGLSKKIWVITISAIVIGLVIPMLLTR